MKLVFQQTVGIWWLTETHPKANSALTQRLNDLRKRINHWI